VKPNKLTRRNFIATSAAVASGIAGTHLLGDRWQSEEVTPSESPTIKAVASTEETSLDIPARLLGKTGLSLPILGLGGAGKTPLNWDSEAEARKLVEAAIELGINYFDTAASSGPSEEY